MLTIGSLCSGYGGLDLAVESVLDARTAWVSDIDKGACKVLAHRFPHAPNLGDMTTVDWSQVEPVDVLTGGTPCQDLSHAGKRAGMTEGTRSNLWVMMREAIAQIRPRLVIWENVGGAYSAEADSELVRDPRLLADTRRRDGEPVLRALGRVLGDLASLGYVGGWHGLRAADVGAPHGRLRVFVVAVPADSAGDSWRLLDRDGGAAADADGGLHISSGARTDQRPVPRGDGDRTRPDRLLPSPRTSDTNGAGQHGDGGLDLRTAVSLLPTPSVADAMGGHESRGGARSHELLLKGIAKRQMWGDYWPGIRRWEHLTRPHPEPTTLGRGGTPQLSGPFTEWMMGLPAGWITDVPGVTRNEALKLCGNGVVPQQAGAAIRFLLGVIAREVAA